MTQRGPESVADLAEELMREFESDLTVSTVTAVVMQLSGDGFISLDELAHLARMRLSSLADSIRTETPRYTMLSD